MVEGEYRKAGTSQKSNAVAVTMPRTDPAAKTHDDTRSIIPLHVLIHIPWVVMLVAAAGVVGVCRASAGCRVVEKR